MLRPGGELVPRFPDRYAMACAQLPSPPLIPEDADDLQAVRLCMRAYRGAVEKHFAQPSFVFARGDIRRSKYWPMLAEASRALRDLEIAPAAWCSFSCDVWRQYHRHRGKGRPPPFAFVFSERRITERRSWFLREAGSYAGGQVQYSLEHKEVLRRYRNLDQVVVRLPVRIARANGGYVPVGAVREAICRAVEEEFPGGYAAWFAKARARGIGDQARIRAMVARGEFVW